MGYFGDVILIIHLLLSSSILHVHLCIHQMVGGMTAILYCVSSLVVLNIFCANSKSCCIHFVAVCFQWSESGDKLGYKVPLNRGGYSNWGCLLTIMHGSHHHFRHPLYVDRFDLYPFRVLDVHSRPADEIFLKLRLWCFPSISADDSSLFTIFHS